MAKIAFLVANEEMAGQAKEVAEKMGVEVELKLVTSENAQSEAAFSVQNGANVVIARGNHAAMIKKNTEIPIVEIVMTGQEIVKIINEAKEIIQKPFPLIAIIGFKNTFGDIKSFNEILNVNIKEYLLDSSEGIKTAVEKAKEDKADLIIGGEIAINFAADSGIPTLFLRSGKDSIREALRIAEKVSFASDIEKKNTAEFKTILDFSFDGIIKLNNEGVVVVFNNLAEAILKRKPEDVLGRHITEVIDLLDETVINSVLTDGKGLYSTLLQKGNLALVANIAPIKVDDRIEGAILSFQEFKKIEDMEAEIRKEVYSKGYLAKYTFKQIIGESPKMLELKEFARIYAKYDAPIVITGETGTGKKMFSECIHNESLRRNNPYVTVDCEAIPPDAFEKRLFGFVESGYMNTPTTIKKGLFEVAHTGTILFDKISELDKYQQLSLLKVLRDGCIVRVGDDRPLPINVRIICSAKTDIAKLVKEGKFSEDLYYLLNVLNLNIYPLRKRVEDITVLVDYFIEQYNNVYRKYIVLTDAAKEVLYSYSWNGNVQQLKKVCEKIVMLSLKKVIDEHFIFDCLDSFEPLANEGKSESDIKSARVVVYKNPEAAKILELLEANKGNRIKVANELDISTTTLWRKIKKYNIESSFGI